MKKLIILSTVTLSISLFSQVAIGKDAMTPNTNVSLEFYGTVDISNDNQKGLLLPWVSTIANQPVAYNSTTGKGYRGIQGNVINGTIIFDLYDKKVKYMKGGSWFDLTGNINFPLSVKDNDHNILVINQFNAIDSSLQDDIKENEKAKVIIGNDRDDSAVGILVLSDKNKAMILPRVASPHKNIKNPSAGMMVYDMTSKQLAIFNGTVWSFWKP